MSEPLTDDLSNSARRDAAGARAPLDELREAVLAAAARARRRSGRRVDNARAPSPRAVRRLLDQRRADPGARALEPAAGGRRAAGGPADRAARGLAGAFRGGGPGLPEPVPRRRLADRGAAGDPRRGGALRRGRREPRPSACWSNSSPRTRPGRCTWATPATPPTGTRWPACWPSTATGWSASSTSTTPARRYASSASRSEAVADGHSPPEDGYKGAYIVGSPQSLKDASDLGPDELGPRR